MSQNTHCVFLNCTCDREDADCELYLPHSPHTHFKSKSPYQKLEEEYNDRMEQIAREVEVIELIIVQENNLVLLCNHYNLQLLVDTVYIVKFLNFLK